jgi:hypothetical protein
MASHLWQRCPVDTAVAEVTKRKVTAVGETGRETQMDVRFQRKKQKL